MERTIHFALDVGAPPETVWRLLVEPVEIPRWWEGVREVQLSAPQVGGRYVLVYESGAPDVAEILGRTPGRLLRCRWTSSEPAPTVIEYRLAPHGGGTRLAFTNLGYGDGGAWDVAYRRNFPGWLGMMQSVLALAEGRGGADA